MQEKNPTDVIEEYVISQEWYYTKNSPHEISAEVDVGWDKPYKLYFFWQPEHLLMHLTCTFGLEARTGTLTETIKLLMLLNSRILVGHFEIGHGDNTIIYRSGFIIMGSRIDQYNIIERATILGLEESNRFYPAIQLVITGTKTAKAATDAVISDIIGEA